MRSSNSPTLTEIDCDEPESSAQDLARSAQDLASSAQDLACPERTPVEASFYESFIIQSRTAVENLYASNVLSCQKHTKELKDLARQRKVKLLLFEREQRKFVKRMEELKLKQEAISSPQYSSPFDSGKAQEAGTECSGKQKRAETVSTVRRSLPPLTKASTTAGTNATGNQSKKVKSPVRLDLRKGTTVSKSCTELRSLSRKLNSRISKSYDLLPAIQNGIKSSRSSENISNSPFVTHLALKIHSDPHKTLVSRECQNAARSMRKDPGWNEKELESDISTKVKWVPK